MTNLPTHRLAVVAAGLLTAFLGNCTKESPSAPAGADEEGALAPQNLTAVEELTLYLDAFHPLKDEPAMQMEAHHFCQAVSEEFTQCVIYDGNARAANLVGVEYIISERLHESLGADEKELWHPHNYEILSGQLVLPGLSGATEKALLQKMMNTYGKTWHLWNTGHAGHPLRDALPVGKPRLAWSFNHDGEATPGLVEGRDRALDINTAQKRQERVDLLPLARPQAGVDALTGAFPHARGQPEDGIAK